MGSRIRVEGKDLMTRGRKVRMDRRKVGLGGLDSILRSGSSNANYSEHVSVCIHDFYGKYFKVGFCVGLQVIGIAFLSDKSGLNDISNR